MMPAEPSSERLQVRPLTSDDEITRAFAIMVQLRPHLKQDEFLARIRRQQAGGYTLLGGFDGARLVCLAGIRDGETLSRGPHLFVDDLITNEPDRGHGFGAEMIHWLRAHARAARLPVLWLDSRDSAVDFYQGCGFTFSASKPCWIDVDVKL